MQVALHCLQLLPLDQISHVQLQQVFRDPCLTDSVLTYHHV